MPLSDDNTLPKGVQVRELTIVDMLGSGGFGVTYLAEHTGLGRKYALKEHFPRIFASREGTTVRPHSHSQGDFDWSRKQFLEEARTLARFKHPNIVHVNNIFEENNTAYMVLDFIDAPTLKEWLKKRRRRPGQAELDDITDALLSALEQLHANNTLHRDIAPDNILIQEDGAPMLIDFGSARIAFGGRTRTLTAVIKEGFSPLEQYATDNAVQKPAVDIYALAATLYNAVTGKAPPESIARVEEDECVPAAKAAKGQYREGFLEAIDAGLAVFAKDRPESIGAWRGMLLDEASPKSVSRQATRSKSAKDASRTAGPQKAGRSERKDEAAADPGPVPAKQGQGRRFAYAALAVVVAFVGFSLYSAKQEPPRPVAETPPARPPEKQVTAVRTDPPAGALSSVTEFPEIGLTVGLNGDGELEIASVASDGPAAQKELKAGDVVVGVELKSVSTPLDIRRAIRSVRVSDGTVLLMSVKLSNQGERFIAIPLGDAR